MRVILLATISGLLFTKGTCDHGWQHGWGSVGPNMMWADFGSPRLLEQDVSDFVAKNYAILSIEKCFGLAQNYTTEDAFLKTASTFKATNPEVKVLFYFHATLDISGCYAAGKEFTQHPDWWLYNDSNKPALNGQFIFHDLRKDAVLDYMASVPAKQQARAPKLLDGVFSDGALPGPYPGIASLEKTAAVNVGINNSNVAIAKALQVVNSNAQVIANGFAFYHQGNPLFPADGGLGMLPYVQGVCVEHWASFEMIDNTNCSTKPALMVQMMENIAKTAALNKTVLVKAWPGPVTTPIEAFGPTYPTSCKFAPAGQTRADRQARMSEWFEPELALFLLVVEPTVYWSYSWWYNVNDGYYPGGNSSSAPPSWFPELKKPIGAPLGPAHRVPGGSGFVYKREFAHVSVQADLGDLQSGTVQFKS